MGKVVQQAPKMGASSAKTVAVRILDKLRTLGERSSDAADDLENRLLPILEPPSPEDATVCVGGEELPPFFQEANSLISYINSKLDAIEKITARAAL